ncbi:unnamed protein product [Blepharisma stoltei]|uniref:EF-hand domain-containing protein n=1 Tax=Blepharisma stoltei TaxID=1481888 RepID=A0AAU9IXZ3_9CILI|nr:unnamed protein product [Blepharisma stoltei]
MKKSCFSKFLLLAYFLIILIIISMIHKKPSMTSRTHSTPQGDLADIFDKNRIFHTPTLPDLTSSRSLKHSITPIAIKTNIMSEFAKNKISHERQKSDIPDEERSPTYKKSTNREKINDLMETLGVLKGSKTFKLPTSIDKLKEVVSDNSKSNESEEVERLELGMPVRRKDVQALADWLDMMLKQVLSEQNEDIEALFEGALLIYNVCFHEIVRQVSVQCVERGELINRVWKAYLRILERALRIVNVKLLVQSQQFLHEKEEIHANFVIEKTRMVKEKDKFFIENEKLQRIIKTKGDEIDRMTRREERLIKKLDILQKQYETTKKEVLYLKEDNRVLQAKLNNSDVEFVERPDGVIELKPKRVLKIKRKKVDDIDEILMKDPLINKVSLMEYGEPEKIVESIRKNSEYEKELFAKLDYKDVGIDVRVLVNEEGQQTEVTELCGESCGEKYFKPPPIPVLELKKSSNFKLVDIIAQKRNEIYEEDEEDEEEEEENDEIDLEKQGKISEEQKVFILNFQEKIDQVNGLIEKMKENFAASANTHDNPFAQSLLKSISKAFVKGREKLQEKEAPLELEAAAESTSGRNRLYNNIQKVKIPKKVVQNNIAKQITYKVLNTPTFKLKHVMIKKMLLRFITQFYDITITKKNDPDPRSMHMPDIVIDTFNHKYGMPKVVETKYKQLLASCIKYKTIKRIYIFGRFLGLYDELSNDDLVVYADCLNFMKAGFYRDTQADYSEIVTVPFDKAIEYHKQFWQDRLSKEENEDLKRDLEKLKKNDKQISIDFDSYFEQIIARIEKKRKIRINFIKCIYDAADFNGDGFLEFVEFSLLVKHIAATKITEKYALELFDKFAEVFTGEHDEEVKALSFENFSHLTFLHQIFTPESLNKFSQISHEKGSIGHLQGLANTINKKIEEFKWRLTKLSNWKESKEEYENYLRGLMQKVKNPTVPDSVWVGYRLIDEESKCICIESTLFSLLPKCSRFFCK